MTATVAAVVDGGEVDVEGVTEVGVGGGLQGDVQRAAAVEAASHIKRATRGVAAITTVGAYSEIPMKCLDPMRR